MLLRVRGGGEQHLGVLLLRVEDHVVGGTVLDDVAMVHHHDLVGEVACGRQIMGDVQHADVLLLLDAGEQVQHAQPQRHVQHRHRLVGDEYLGLGRQGARDGDTLALAAGQLVGPAVHELRRRGELHSLEQLDDLLFVFLAAVRQMVEHQRTGDVMEDRVVRVQRGERVLEHHLDVVTVLVQLPAVRGDWLAVQRDGAGRRRLQAGDHPRDGRLAGSGLTDQRDRLVRRQFERRVLHRVDGGGLQSVAELEVLLDVVKFQY